MDENYNDYLYEINEDLSITLLNNCCYNDDIPEPDIDVNEKTNSIAFDFGWHIFEIEVTSSFYLALAAREKSIGISCYEDKEDLPFSMKDNDEVFVGSFNVLENNLSLITLDYEEACFGLSNGKFRFPLAKNIIEYYTSPVNIILDESYRVRLLFNEDKEKGGILIQKGPIGFRKNILTPLLNQIDLIGPLQKGNLIIQKQKLEETADKTSPFYQEFIKSNSDVLVNEYIKSNIDNIMNKYESESSNKESISRFKEILTRIYYEAVFFTKASALLIFSLSLLQVFLLSISFLIQFFNIGLN